MLLDAATVVLLREARDGPLVFLLRRSPDLTFMPGVWVFPGGRVDAGDALADHPRVLGGKTAAARFDLPLPEAVALAVCAARETLEESGVWIGSGTPPTEVRTPLARGEVELATLLDDHGLYLDIERLVPWSRWVTPRREARRFDPSGSGRRYDTRFFVVVTRDAGGSHDDRESVDSGWFTIPEVLGSRTMKLSPPTWWTLTELNEHATAAKAVASRSSRPIRPIEPVMVGAGDELVGVLPGHPRHPEPRIPGLPISIRLTNLGWHATFDQDS